MSQTFSLVCRETKQVIWVGQGHEGKMTNFYTGNPRVMDRLGDFLRATAGKNIVLVCNDLDSDHYDYEDFDDGMD